MTVWIQLAGNESTARARSQSPASLQFTWWSSCVGAKVHRLMGLGGGEQWAGLNGGYLFFFDTDSSFIIVTILNYWVVVSNMF